MPVESRTIIAELPPSARVERIIQWSAFGLALALGIAGAWRFASLQLTLTHYDARAHLVVARRIIDSLTPGWRQVGAVWLPLPHLLNAIPVQWDWNYQTGASGVAISVLAMAWGLGALARYLYRHTGSTWVALAAPLAALLNPDIWYLQSTPMTEPLLFGLSLACLLAVDDWIAAPSTRQARRAGLWLCALVLTRYEGWLVGASLVTLAFAARPRLKAVVPLALYPLLAVGAFFAESYYSSGVLLVTSGFFTPNNNAKGRPLRALAEVAYDAHAIEGWVLAAVAIAGVGVLLARTWRTRGRSLLPLSLFATAVLPAVAFYDGHPERVRYMVPLVIASAASAGFALAAVPKRMVLAVAAVFLAAALIVRSPFSLSSPMILEAQWEVPHRDARVAVTRYLSTAYDGTPILASMGATAPFMQESSSIGLRIRNFLHEGNGILWTDALAHPQQYVRWILIEEQAEGGGMLAEQARSDPSFLSGFSRVAEGGGLALYERTAAQAR